MPLPLPQHLRPSHPSAHQHQSHNPAPPAPTCQLPLEPTRDALCKDRCPGKNNGDSCCTHIAKARSLLSRAQVYCPPHLGLGPASSVICCMPRVILLLWLSRLVGWSCGRRRSCPSSTWQLLCGARRSWEAGTACCCCLRRDTAVWCRCNPRDCRRRRRRCRRPSCLIPGTVAGCCRHGLAHGRHVLLVLGAVGGAPVGLDLAVGETGHHKPPAHRTARPRWGRAPTTAAKAGDDWRAAESAARRRSRASPAASPVHAPAAAPAHTYTTTHAHDRSPPGSLQVQQQVRGLHLLGPTPSRQRHSKRH